MHCVPPCVDIVSIVNYYWRTDGHTDGRTKGLIETAAMFRIQSAVAPETDNYFWRTDGNTVKGINRNRCDVYLRDSDPINIFPRDRQLFLTDRRTYGRLDRGINNNSCDVLDPISSCPRDRQLFLTDIQTYGRLDTGINRNSCNVYLRDTDHVSIVAPYTEGCEEGSQELAQHVPGYLKIVGITLLGASEITANLYWNCVHLYWEGCVICSMYLR